MPRRKARHGAATAMAMADADATSSEHRCVKHVFPPPRRRLFTEWVGNASAVVLIDQVLGQNFPIFVTFQYRPSSPRGFTPQLQLTGKRRVKFRPYLRHRDSSASGRILFLSGERWETERRAAALIKWCGRAFASDLICGPSVR